MNVNCGHIETFDANLYRQLVCYPQEVIPALDAAVNEMYFERYPADTLEHQIQVRPFNAAKTKNMRSLNPEGYYILFLRNNYLKIVFFLRCYCILMIKI